MEKPVRIANLVLVGLGVFCLTVLIYVVYQDNWTQERAFANLPRRLLYYGGPALMAGLCFALLRLPPARRINTALLLLSTGASVYVGETMLTVWFSLPSVRGEMAGRARAEIAKQFGVDFDLRTKLEVAEDLQEEGVDAYPTGTPQDLLEKQADGTLKSQLSMDTEMLPLGWISGRASVLCNESGDFVLYESDEHGFHNPKGLWKTRGIEIVAVGDSFTHGWCVPSDRSFVALIRQQYPATLNLGSNGHGPLTMLATLKEYGALVRPRVVLWFHYEGNDLRDLKVEGNSPLVRGYLEPNFRQDLAKHQIDIDRSLITYINKLSDTSLTSVRLAEIGQAVRPGALGRRTGQIIKLSQLRRALGLVYGRSGHDRPREQESPRHSKEEMELFAKTLREAKKTVTAWGAQLYFVYLPEWSRYANPAVAKSSRDGVLRTARASGFHVIDMHEAFKAQPDPLALFPFGLNGHYNEAGHQLVAEQTLRSIAAR